MLVALELVAGAALVLHRSAPPPVPYAEEPRAVVAPGLVPALGGLRPPGPALQRLRVAPRLQVDALDVDARVVPLRTRPGGELEVPAAAADVGWWSEGPVPGDAGAAVLVGHVDLDGRPGVFAGLRALRPGAEVRVRRPDGTVAVFVVERVEQHPKQAFPTDRVYAPTARPTLRLVTCGGGFDARTGHYRDNVVAFARLAA